MLNKCPSGRQYTNAIYVLGADASNPSGILIYDVTAKSWSTQSVNTGNKFDPMDFAAILDHDTNVFCGCFTLGATQISNN
jgi:hypothetical protein